MHHLTDRIAHTMTFVNTSRAALARMRNSSMGQPWRIDPMTHCTMSECSYHRAILFNDALKHLIYGYMASYILLDNEKANPLHGLFFSDQEHGHLYMHHPNKQDSAVFVILAWIGNNSKRVRSDDQLHHTATLCSAPRRHVIVLLYHITVQNFRVLSRLLLGFLFVLFFNYFKASLSRHLYISSLADS